MEPEQCPTVRESETPDRDNPCSSCTTGCTARHTEEEMSDEISAVAYLIIGGVLIVVLSLVIRWFFG